MVPGRPNLPRAASSDSVEVLEEAPEHLQRRNNRDARVIVDSDDEEPVPRLRPFRKRPASPSIEVLPLAKRHQGISRPEALRSVRQAEEAVDAELTAPGQAPKRCQGHGREPGRSSRVETRAEPDSGPSQATANLLGHVSAPAGSSQHVSAPAGSSRHAGSSRLLDHLPCQQASASAPSLQLGGSKLVPLAVDPILLPQHQAMADRPPSPSVNLPSSVPPCDLPPGGIPPMPAVRSREPSPVILVSPADQALTRILEILPDIDPAWALVQIYAHKASPDPHHIYEQVITFALEMSEGYPKAPVKGKEMGKGKGKEVEVDAEEGAAEGYKSLVYRRDRRLGRVYFRNALSALDNGFPTVPLAHLRSTFYKSDILYTPTYLTIIEQSEKNPKPWVELKRPRKSKNVVVIPNQELVENGDDEGAAEFEREKEWLDALLEKETLEKNEVEAKRIAYEKAIAQGHGIECGCCFGEELLENMVQCAEGHLFCKDCAMRHAETKLGDQQTLQKAILCMDTGGCQYPFPESELSRLLSSTSLGLYHRLKQAKELELAGIEGLESCPSCPYSAIIDDPNEKLFRCMREGCMQVTCRKCRHQEHIPKTCEEMATDRKLNSRHAVEDAMSEALIRKCPKCSKPFIKESGCNKIMCTGCRTLSCYICRQVITGYEHFDQDPSDYGKQKIKGRCRLWDPANNANPDNDAIMAARDAAQARAREEAEAEGIRLADEDLDVAMPVGPGIARRIVQRIGMPGLQRWARGG